MPVQRHTLSGWGRLPLPGREVRSENLERSARDVTLTRGLGRSYGDSSLPPKGRAEVAGSVLADRILAFDPETGVLLAEAGLSLGALNRIFLPRGFASPVATGTQYVTLGGMVAADVHGKNHHCAGTFGAHVQRLKMLLADGEVVWCSREQRRDLFLATLGGMGLTGHILEVEVKLEAIPSPWIWAESERIPNLDQFLIAVKEAAAEWPFTVGWIDCLKRGRHMGRGILMRGRWARPEEAPKQPPADKKRLAVPFDAPSWALNQLSARAFNMVYYGKHVPRVKRGIAHPESFFHPLDFVIDWNRIYGARGFTQHACVIPYGDDPKPVRRFLELLTSLRIPSFLSVLKDFGSEGEGMLSFPKPGMSICLDIPVRRDTAELIGRLDDFVLSCGGRIYLAKDAFTTAERFRQMEPRLESWRAVRRKWDPQGRLASAQSVRLLGDEA
ncbi:MAG: FAD-binding oxidoreductase [Acidobacteriota bacterium]